MERGGRFRAQVFAFVVGSRECAVPLQLRHPGELLTALRREGSNGERV